MEIYIVILFSYLSGSIPFGYILTKSFGNIDIRKIGSGNIGATNVLRTGKKFLAASTLLLDILKGYIPVAITSYYFSEFIQISCLLTFLGHLVVCGILRASKPKKLLTAFLETAPPHTAS